MAIAASADDCGVTMVSGVAMNFTNSAQTLPLGTLAGNLTYEAAFRFAGSDLLPLVGGATILSATVRLQAHGVWPSPPTMHVHFEDAGNPGQISSAAEFATRRANATDGTDWTIPATVDGEWITSPDLSDYIHEVIHRADFTGQAVMIFLHDHSQVANSYMTVRAYDHLPAGDSAAILSVCYSPEADLSSSSASSQSSSSSSSISSSSSLSSSSSTSSSPSSASSSSTSAGLFPASAGVEDRDVSAAGVIRVGPNSGGVVLQGMRGAGVEYSGPRSTGVTKIGPGSAGTQRTSSDR